MTDLQHDPVNHPSHYTASPSGVECIDVVEHLPFCVGNAIKYLWRAGLKGDAIQDLEKARWYVDREIQRQKRARRIADGLNEGWVRGPDGTPVLDDGA